MTFLGTQPTFTQVPPRRWGSITAALAPYSAARCAQARPPLPPPTLMRSNAKSATSALLAQITEGCMIRVRPRHRRLGQDVAARLVESECCEQPTFGSWRVARLW